MKRMLKRQLNRLRKSISEDKDLHHSLSIQLSAHSLLTIKASHTLVSIFLTSLPPALRIVPESQIDGKLWLTSPFLKPFHVCSNNSYIKWDGTPYILILRFIVPSNILY